MFFVLIFVLLTDTLDNSSDNALQGSAHDCCDTPYRKACRRTWAQLIEKVYLVSPLVCPKCRCPMNILSFIEDPPIVRKILKHLGIGEIKAWPPPRKNVSPCTGESIPQECLSWAAETMYDNMYDNVDQVYEDSIVFYYDLPHPRSS